VIRKQLAAVVIGGITVVACAAVAFAAIDTSQSADDTADTGAPAFQASAQDDDGGGISAADYDRAAQAALDAVGGGKVLDVDRENEGGATWEVEILKSDGTEADVLLDAQFRVLNVGSERDDDRGGSDDGDGGKDDGDSGKDD
jgi:uncharacterized membrane protein YkoI